MICGGVVFEFVCGRFSLKFGDFGFWILVCSVTLGFVYFGTLRFRFWCSLMILLLSLVWWMFVWFSKIVHTVIRVLRGVVTLEVS